MPIGERNSSLSSSPGWTGVMIFFSAIFVPFLMVVDDLHVVSVPVLPDEAQPVAVVDPDGVLALPIPGELLQAVAGRHAQVVHVLGVVQLHEFPQGLPLQVRRERLRPPPPPDPRGLLLPEALYHRPNDNAK